MKSFCFDPSAKSPRTIKNRKAAIFQLMNFAVRKNWIRTNFVGELPVVAKEDKEPGILTVAEAEALLLQADKYGLLPYVAIGLFAGVRSQELRRLDFRKVNLQEREITIGSDIAKTRSRRLIEFDDALVAWLELCWKPSGPVVDTDRVDNQMRYLKKAAGIKKWPRNGIRHSFASYHLAHHQNEQLTVLMMGHSGGSDMLHNHYKGLVSRTEAEKYWALRPPESLKHKICA